MNNHDTLSMLAERLHAQRQRKAKRSAHWWFTIISSYVAAIFLAASGGTLIGIGYSTWDMVLGAVLIAVAWWIVPTTKHQED